MIFDSLTIYTFISRVVIYYLKTEESEIMKKTLGINRNKLSQFQTAKLTTMKRKNRFKSISKEEDLEISCILVII